jgi:hypothetical protein
MNHTAEQLKKDVKGLLTSFNGPKCPYCGGQSHLQPEAFIYKGSYEGKNYWVCENYPSCHSYVGTHGHGQWMNYPLGRLANGELRKLKTQAHSLFDPFWKTGTYTRGHMYRWFQDNMQLPEALAHIGELDEAQCHDLIHKLNQLYETVQLKPKL